MNDRMTETILIVDDDEILRSRLARAFADRGWRTEQASCGEQAMETAARLQPDRAVLDLKMPGIGGLEVLRRLRDASPRTAVVVLTGYGSIANAVEAMKLGAVNYVTKPADADEVLSAFGGDAPPAEERNDEYLPPSLAEAEWHHIQRVLTDCSGNISEAARLLDIPRRTLQRKLKKLPP
ncbi:MAG TPA: DNA-binding response regulator [Planctomycetaceae bacterium]|nr:DNA-binding response regulator [Planctomycetaceae bacterium]HRE99240.1 response regulator [Pirellulaceae bacterium]